MGFNLTLKVDGATKIDKIIQNISELPKDLREPFGRVRRIVQGAIAHNIIGLGRGDGWQPLSKATIADKEASGYNTPPGVRTGEMSHSLTGDGDNTINEIERDRAAFGAIGVKVAVFQRGNKTTGRQPARNLLYLDDKNKRDIVYEFKKEVRNKITKAPNDFFKQVK